MVPLVVHHLPSAILIHLSVRMTPSSLHAFLRSSCHTLALQSLPCSSSLASSLRSLSHDLSSPSESALVGSEAPLIHRKQVNCPRKNDSSLKSFCFGFFSARDQFRGQHPSPMCGQIKHGEQCSRYTHRSIGPLLWFVSIFILCTKYSLLLPPMSNTHANTHTCAQRGYILIKTGA